MRLNLKCRYDNDDDNLGRKKSDEDYKNTPVPRMKGLSRVVTLLQKQVKDSEERILKMLESKMDSNNAHGAGSGDDSGNEDSPRGGFE